MTTQKNGASALGLQRVLGLKQYQTAWTWLHKLRSAMVRPGRDLLTGRVEVDECQVGGLEEGLRGRLIESKALVIVATQEDGRGIGRIRLRLIPDASAESLHPFIQESVAPGSVIHGGWRGYYGLRSFGIHLVPHAHERHAGRHPAVTRHPTSSATAVGRFLAHPWSSSVSGFAVPDGGG